MQHSTELIFSFHSFRHVVELPQICLNQQNLDNESSLEINQFAEICLMLEVKLAFDLYVKFNFYDIVGQETKAGCPNLTYNLLNRNLNN